jgi:hypothetical protein
VHELLNVDPAPKIRLPLDGAVHVFTHKALTCCATEDEAWRSVKNKTKRAPESHTLY